MKIRICSFGTVALALIASSSAYADAHVSVDINPFGWGVPPPLVYVSPRYYGPPPVVYYGRGHWGDHRGGRGHDRDHGGSEHHH
ncbi:MAG: hypothetical protein ACLQJ0_02720 [Steroidobacteraceae bacterium]|jgi:hypothetical protein